MPLNTGTGDLPGIPVGTSFILPSNKSLSDYKVVDGCLVERSDRDRECLHIQLERSLPPNQKGQPHALVCNCPKCSITC